MRTKSLICLMTVLIIGFSCQQKFDTQSGNSQDWENLQKTILEFDNAWDTGDTEKKLEIFADDGIFLPQGREMIIGTEALRENFESIPKEISWKFERDKIKLEMEGDIAYEVVNQLTTITQTGQEPRTIPQKYVHVWKKQQDGSWKVIIDIYNLRKSEQALESR
jgi:uncharacterized protein (TIGR02246 family)